VLVCVKIFYVQLLSIARTHQEMR